MRCPKCSFISFDQVETCAKCGKNISTAAENLHGTTVAVPAPPFLKYEFEEPQPQAEEVLEESTADMSAGEEEYVDFSMEEGDAPEMDLGSDEIEMDFGVEETADEAEPVIDLGTEEADEEAIDISGLAPSEEPEMEIEADLGEEPVEEPVAEEGVREGQGLKDLKVDIDLEDTEAPKGKVMPSVKTGTALDDFDIDLGDLITSKKD